ncbi:hypothetical protein EG68_07467 [Paragonimus skrjabini miyazakii]|uniref:Uncharacterized protein n=1 Tax=Paragonimus skrjabini miyazakii TaxID=59628 RepID=A0A8S9YAJ9_9TREM|nr:hypothetical protein EG68_07467 [Paragonimus skrjabini miyazakii]
MLDTLTVLKIVGSVYSLFTVHSKNKKLHGGKYHKFNLSFRCLYRSPDISVDSINNIIMSEVTPSTLVLADLLSYPADTIQIKDMRENVTASTAQAENEKHSPRTNNRFTDSNVEAVNCKPTVACHKIIETVNERSSELRLEVAIKKNTQSSLLCNGIPLAQQFNATYNSNDEHQNSSVVGTDKAEETHTVDDETGQKEHIRMKEVMELLKQRWFDLFHNRNVALLETSKRPKLRTEQSPHNSEANQFWIELLTRHGNIMEYVPGDKLSNYDGPIEKLVGLELVRIIRLGDLDSFSTVSSSIRILRLVKCNLKNEQLYGLEKLRNLEVLDLSENELKQFTTDENALPHLVALNLSNNRLCTLDQLSGPYPALRELNISSNFLMRIGEVKIKASNLLTRYFYLCGHLSITCAFMYACVNAEITRDSNSASLLDGQKNKNTIPARTQ